MNRKKNIFLILCLLTFALYHTLPTVFYYFRPLNSKISPQKARKIVDSIVGKVNRKRRSVSERIQSTLDYLKIKPQKILQSKTCPGITEVLFSESSDAEKFAKILFYGENSVSSKSERLFLEDFVQDSKGGIIVKVSNPIISEISREDFEFVSLDANGSRSEREDYIVQKVTDLIGILYKKGKDANCCGYFDSKIFSSRDVVKFAEGVVAYEKIFSENLSYALGFLFDSLEQANTFTSQAKKLLEEGIFKNDLVVEAQLKESLRILNNIRPVFHKGLLKITPKIISLEERHPLIEAVSWDVCDNKVNFILKDLESLRSDNSEVVGLVRDFKRQTFRFIEKEFGYSPEEKEGVIEVPLVGSQDASGLIVFKGASFLEQYSQYIASMLREKWSPQTFDLKSDYYPISAKCPELTDAFGCYVFCPGTGCKHFSPDSLYVVAKGFNAILEKYSQIENHEKKELFYSDLERFLGFFSRLGFSSVDCREDKIFELTSPLGIIADASGENFIFRKGSSNGILEVSDVAKRLSVTNEIESREHNALLRWHNAHRHVKYSLDETLRLQVAVPYKNVFYNNLRLATGKYFRGAKALKWGLDVAGGKTVKLAFKDFNGQDVNSKEIIDRVSGELHSRLNHLGVSEVQVRREGKYVNVDFPSSAGIPASDLICSSALRFHVVNEKFSSYGNFADSVRLFLRDVWQMTNRLSDNPSIQLINETAQSLLQDPRERDYLKILKDEGLIFSGDNPVSSALDERISTLVFDRSGSFEEVPLVIVFKNYALEGASLFDIGTSFDIKEGNVLHFCIKKSMTNKFGNKIFPSEDLYNWTERFSESAIRGSPEEKYSSGRGWRMAVVVNDSVISMPSLNCPLRDNARITGNFSYEEAAKLAGDLKLGTMSFVPEIVSEQNIDPELGKVEKLRSITAALLGICVVVVLMCVYYRFGGAIASGAVLLNLLIIWAILQYFEATLTLSSLSGITLALGMAVDANVLVFERIREEYLLSRNLHLALESGYKKAFTAILDSNVTTILAAGILLFLDTGPIKGFALTLIIGICSSMFTALFLTKVFFDFWVEKTDKKEFNMMSKFIGLKVNFIADCRKMWVVSLSILVAGCVALGCGALSSLPGMDFKGGFAFTLNSEGISMNGQKNVGVLDIMHAFAASGYSTRDYRVRMLDQAKKIKIYFNRSISEETLPVVDHINSKKYAFEDIPWLAESISILNRSGIEISHENLNNLHLTCSGVSGQFSGRMKNQALYGLILALLGILIYVSLRFEWQYALSAVVALIHDLLVTCALLAAVHFFIKNLQFDLQAVGALITVLGYSLNNTIIIFDRIRETDRTNDSNNFTLLVNTALNGTLSRTVMTTGTTLSVLLILLFVGGDAIFNFAFILTTGILIGTLSSLYVAPPLLLYINGLLTRKRSI